MGYWIVNGQKMTNEQHEEWKKQQRLEKQKIQEEATRLSRQLGEAYAALKNHLEQNPDTGYKITDERELDQQIYYNLRQNLQRADAAPRCTWIREDGTVCKSPRMKNDIHCYAHCQMRKAQAGNLALPALTDANAIQMAVMLVQRALIDGEITEKMAGLLLYSIQIAAANVGKTTFGQAEDEEMVTEIHPEDYAEQIRKLNRIEKARTLPLVATDLKTEEQTSPRINTDQTDQFGEKPLPLIHTDNTDLKTGEQTSPLMSAEHTDLNREVGKILPQSASLVEGYANLDPSFAAKAAAFSG